MQNGKWRPGQFVAGVKKRWHGLMYGGLIVAIAVIAWLSNDGGVADKLGTAGIWIVSGLLLVCFVDLFTVPAEDDAAGRRQIRRWMVFSYTFMMFAIFVSIVPFLSEDNGDASRVRPIMAIKGCVGSSPEASELHCRNGNYQWLISIGSTLVEVPAEGTDAIGEVPNGSKSYFAYGGLVVPLYVIVISLMGAAISLTRRIPEIQKLGSRKYVPTEEEPALSPLRVREKLVFQIVQFISAPLLAIVAYQLLGSTSPQSSVLIGFVAGFSSETVLVMIRNLFDKIRPVIDSSPIGGSVSGLVWNSTANQPLADARVSVVGQSGAETRTDERGFFTLDGVSAGERVIEASHGDIHAMARVDLKDRKSATCHLELAVAP